MNEIEEINRLTERIIGAAIAVHREVGPGLLESAYEACMAYELAAQGLSFQQQMPMPVHYKGVALDCGYRMDLVVEDRVVVELKAVETITPVHRAQVQSYLKLSGYKIGLLINFHVKLLKDGVERIVCGEISGLARIPRK